MAKKVKFTLEMKDGVQARTLEDLQENFDLEKVIGYFNDGKLQTWLEERYYEEEAEAIGNLSPKAPNLPQEICEILGVDTDEFLEIDMEEVEWRKQRLEHLRQYTADKDILDKVDNTAFDQEELGDLLADGADEIILCNNSFRIPLKQKNKTYIGVGNAEAVIKSKEKVDFAALGIKFIHIKFDEEYEQIEQHNVVEETFDKNKHFENKEDKRAYFQDAAEKGNAEAMFELGCIYLYDFEYKDYEKALGWLKKAEEGGIEQATTCIGYMYENGLGLNKANEKAMEQYIQAANAGESEAMCKLGSMYSERYNYLDAIEWYIKAARKNNKTAFRLIGELYYYGTGVKKDVRKAHTWWLRASNAGDETAKRWLDIRN